MATSPERNNDLSAEVKTTTCYMCACRCGIRVHLRDAMGGSFNMREFFHGRSREVVRAVRWYFFAEAKHPQNLYYQAIA